MRLIFNKDLGEIGFEDLKWLALTKNRVHFWVVGLELWKI
jgi:hypothetical protein